MTLDLQPVTDEKLDLQPVGESLDLQPVQPVADEKLDLQPVGESLDLQPVQPAKEKPTFLLDPNWEEKQRLARAYSGPESDSSFLSTVASAAAENPKQFSAEIIKAIPQLVMAPFAAAGQALNAGVQDAMTTVAGHPEYGGNVYEFLDRTSPDEAAAPLPYQETLKDISASHPKTAIAGKVAAGAVESAPMMIAGIPAGVTGKLISLGFSADMLRAGGDAATRLGEEMGKPPEQRDADKVTSAVADLVQSGVFAPMAGAHGAKETVSKTAAIAGLSKRLLNEPKLPAGEVRIGDARTAPFEEGAVAPAGDETFSEFGGEQKPALDLQPVPPAPSPKTVAPTTMLQPKAFPVVEVPLKELSLSKDVPNFKADADEETGVVAGQKLEGNYERLGTGAITVYERLDGSREVISGRHRFDLAKRAGEESIPSQIVREADGFTPQMAMVLDAEMNIRDGQGSVSDYANYFRNAEVDPGEAASRGLLARQKGKAGWTIGRNLSDDAFALYRAGKITEGQAQAIGEAAPASPSPGGEGRGEVEQQNTNLQRVGIKAALDGKSPQELKNFIQAVRLETRSLPPEQFDLFAADDSALKEAERLARIATIQQNELSREIRATDAAARNATTAKAKGVKFDRPPEEILAENETLKAELASWNNWALDPSKVQRVRDYAEMDRSSKTSKTKAWAESVISEGRKRLNVGVDPELLAAYAVKGAHAIKAYLEDYSAEREKALARGPFWHVENWSYRADSNYTKYINALGEELTIRISNHAKPIGHATEPSNGFDFSYVGDKRSGLKWLKETIRASGLDLQTEADLTRRVAQLKSEAERKSQERIAEQQKQVEEARVALPIIEAALSRGVEPYMREGLKQTEILLTPKRRQMWERELVKAKEKASPGEKFVSDNSQAGMLGSGQTKTGESNVAIEQQLDKLKIDTNGQLHAFGLLPEAWNTLIDLVKLGIKGGRAAAEAIDWAIAQIKTKFPEQKLDEASARTALSAQFSEGPARQRVQKILSDETVSPEVKAGVAPDLNYTPRGFTSIADEARAIIQQHGVEEAEKLFTNPRAAIPLDTRQAIGAQLQDHFRTQERLARASGDTAKSDYFAGKQVDLWKADAYGTELAQGLNARKLYDAMSPAGMLRQAKELFGEQAEKQWNERLKPAADTVKETLRKANDEAVEAVRKDPEVNRAARTAVDEAIEKSPHVHRAVVVEMAEPFAQSPTIVQAAREALRGRVTELMNQQPPKARTAEYHRALLRQLQEQAVSIANGHYQGAEPGVTLKEKLMKRLGLPEGMANRLVKTFDSQFADMVERAKKKLKDRVATQRARRELLMRPQDYVSQSRSVWSREKQAASESLVKALQPSAAPKTALQEFSGRLTARLREQLAVGKKPAKAKLSDIEIMREALQNADKYQEVWDQALHDIQQKFGPDAVTGLDPIAKLFGHGQVDRIIRTQLKEMNVNLGKAVEQHRSVVDATGKTLGERVVRVSGLSGDAADRLAETFHRRFEELATQRKRAALEQLDKLSGRAAVPRQIRGQYEKLIRLSNLGAFEDSKFYDLIKKHLDLPVMTDELAREIAKRANDLEKLPEGNLRDRAATDLLNYVARQRGLKWADLPMGIFYSNILSGLTTPAKIAFENTNLLVGNTITSMITRPRDVLGNPVNFFKTLASSYGRGLKKGGLLGADILKTGVTTGVQPGVRPSSVMELKPFGEKLEPLNLWKYVMREISAVHVSTFKPAMEIKWNLLARDVAAKEGLSGRDLEQRVADLMANTEARVSAAKAQAAGELTALGNKSKIDFHRRVDEILEQEREANMPGSTELARDFALRSTYLNEPYGFFGLIANGVRSTLELGRKEYPVFGTAAKTQIPFTTIVANILNEKLNWTPVGTVRAALSLRNGKLYGREMMEASERSELLAKSIVGTVALGTLAAVFGQQIHGGGPSDANKRKQLQATGWIPHSIKVGEKYYSYMNTPAAVGLAIIGNWIDWHRYGKGNDADGVSRVAFVTKATANAIVQQGMLDSLRRIMEALGSESTAGAGDKLQKLGARTASSFVIPNLLQQLDRFWDPTVYDQTGMKALLTSQVPIVRRENKPALNVLGEPVQSGPFHYWASTQSKDPVWRVLMDKQAFISEPPKNEIIGDKKHYRAMTHDEYYDYVATSGRSIRQMLTEHLDRIRTLDADQAQMFVRKIVEIERAKAKRKFSL